MLGFVLVAALGVTKTCDTTPCSLSIDISATVMASTSLAVEEHSSGPGWTLVEVTIEQFHQETDTGTKVHRYAVIGDGPIVASAEGLVAPGSQVYALAPTGPWPTAQRMAIAVRAVEHWRRFVLALERACWGRAT